MKKACFILTLTCAFLVVGCGSNSDNSARNNGTSGSVDEVLFQKISEEDGMQNADNEINEVLTEINRDTDADEKDNAAIDASADDNNDMNVADTAHGEETVAVSTDSGVDVDLTVLSATMVYSEVYNMMVSPDYYKGKIIKMTGQFVPYYDEGTGKYYFACFISDATACCSQGIEFILTDDYSYPEDYPQEGDTICVIGTFDTYMEGEYMYCTLRDADLSD